MAAADSIPGKAPAFQFYPNDFLSDANVIVMSLQERGAYITLICVCWQQGTLPNNVEQLARFCGAPVQAFRKMWPAVEKCFKVSANGLYLLHPRLERERKKQREYRKLQSDKGKASAASRNRGSTAVQPRLDSGSTEGQPAITTPVQPKPNSSSSVFSLHTSAPAKKDTSPSADDVLSERAGRFLERYQALYQRHRKGAHYLVRPHLDYPKAKELCATWEDARLDQLVQAFLTTDHKFAEEGSRTIGQFAALASWCDSQLIEAGIA